MNRYLNTVYHNDLIFIFIYLFVLITPCTFLKKPRFIPVYTSCSMLRNDKKYTCHEIHNIYDHTVTLMEIVYNTCPL